MRATESRLPREICWFTSSACAFRLHKQLQEAYRGPISAKNILICPLVCPFPGLSNPPRQMRFVYLASLSASARQAVRLNSSPAHSTGFRERNYADWTEND